MNFLKKMEEMLEQVDSQAQKTIQSPKTVGSVLPAMLSSGALGLQRDPTEFDRSTQALIDEEIDLDLSLDAGNSRLHVTPSQSQVRAAPKSAPVRSSKLAVSHSRPKPAAKPIERDLFAEFNEETPKTEAKPKPSSSAWDDWDTEAGGPASPPAASSSPEDRATADDAGERIEEVNGGEDVVRKEEETEAEEEKDERAADGEAGNESVEQSSEEDAEALLEASLPRQSTVAEPPASSFAPPSPEVERKTVRGTPDSSKMVQELSKAKMKLAEVSTENNELKVEYRLVKSRFSSLQQKAKELQGRHVKLQQALKNSQVQMKRLQEDKDTYMKQAKALESQQRQLDDELDSRDGQQAELQERLLAREEELAKAKEQLEELTVQIEQYSSVHRELEDGKHRQVTEEAQKREELEEELEEQKRQLAVTREEHGERERKLEEEVSQLSGTLNATLEELQQLKERHARDQVEMKQYIKDTQALRQELTGYKKRAAQVLQEKDTQIMNLSQAPDVAEGDSEGNGRMSSSMSGQEVDRLVEERDELKRLYEETEERLQALSESLMEAEGQAAEEVDALREQVEQAGENLAKEKTRVKTMQMDMLSTSKELASAREKLDQAQYNSKKELEAKEQEVEKLRKKLQLKVNTTATSSDLEERLQQMTDNILRKQTTIDTLSSENSALQMQLESRLPNAEQGTGLKSYQSREQSRRVANDIEEEEMGGRERDSDRVTPLMTLVPNLATSNSFFAQKVKAAATAVDGWTASLNQLLRQHPSARVSIGLYLEMSSVTTTRITSRLSQLRTAHPGSTSGMEVATIPSREFFDKYIAKREPVVLQGHLTDPAWKATTAWTLENLKEEAGECEVGVEQREEVAGASFGRTTTKHSMPFKEALAHLWPTCEESKDAAKESQYYLTTQEIAEAADGLPLRVYGEPLRSLRHHFPLRPVLMGNLVPYQMNLWMGHSCTGTSSGLHHDFHDNLYILLNGRKRFTLFSPQEAHLLYTRGEVSEVHANGVINYKGSPQARSDGADAANLLAYRKQVAEAELMRAESHMEAVRSEWQAAGGSAGAGPEVEKRMTAAEDRLAAAESALDSVLGGVLSDDDWGGDFVDDYEEDEMDRQGGDSSEEDKEEPENASITRSGSVVAESKKEEETSVKHAHFSRVTVAALRDDSLAKRDFPLILQAKSRREVWVEAGQMLFLPAGWFHEVTSFSTELGDKATNGSTHMALNYWFHPPATQDYEQPYEDGYWDHWWAGRAEQYLSSAGEPPKKKVKQ